MSDHRRLQRTLMRMQLDPGFAAALRRDEREALASTGLDAEDLERGAFVIAPVVVTQRTALAPERKAGEEVTAGKSEREPKSYYAADHHHRRSQAKTRNEV